MVWTIIIILVLLLIYYYGCGSDGAEQQVNKSLELDETGESGLDSETGDVDKTVDCPLCDDCDSYDCDEECDDKYDDCDSCCPSCPICSSCPESKTVIKGAEELALDSLLSLDGYIDRIINVDNENFTYWLANTKDYGLNNIHTKLVITIDDDTDKTVISDVYSLSSKQNKSFYLPVGLDPRSEEYEAELTIYAANNKGITKDVEFKVHDLNPDVEQSKAFWENSIIGFSEYKLTDSQSNLTFVNNKNSEVTVEYLKVDDEMWLVNESLASGEHFEFSKDVGLCDSEIYSLPVYINYTSGGFEFVISEDQELVGYCK